MSVEDILSRLHALEEEKASFERGLVSLLRPSICFVGLKFSTPSLEGFMA